MKLDGKREYDEEIKAIIAAIDGIPKKDSLKARFAMLSKAGFDPNQRRGDDGRWSDGTGSYSKIDPEKQAKTHKEQYSAEDDSYGSTFNPITGESMTGEPFFTVGIGADKGRTFYGDSHPTAAQIADFIKANEDLLSQPGYALGTWYSEKDGGLFIDVVHLLSDRKAAIKLGRDNKEVGIFDLLTGEFMETGGTGKVEDKAKPTTEKQITGWAQFMRSLNRKPKD